MRIATQNWESCRKKFRAGSARTFPPQKISGHLTAIFDLFFLRQGGHFVRFLTG